MEKCTRDSVREDLDGLGTVSQRIVSVSSCAGPRFTNIRKSYEFVRPIV